MVSALMNGTMTRGQVLRAVAEDPDRGFRAESRVRLDAVLWLYASQSERPAGYGLCGIRVLAWPSSINFNGDYLAAEMVKAFIASRIQSAGSVNNFIGQTGAESSDYRGRINH